MIFINKNTFFIFINFIQPRIIMNIEDLAKKDLFDYDEFDVPLVYDPYRNNNILKDSNRPTDSL